MISLSDLRQFKQDGRKFSCLTCYDASMAKAMELAEVDTILIGDSLGMAIQGRDSTLPVTVEDMAYHTAAVRRGNQHALIMTDLPFMSYATLNDALVNAKTVMQAGAQMVKIEGGRWLTDTVRMLTERAVPVCGHLGLTPQSVNIFGGYKVQGRSDDAATTLFEDALALEAAGIGAGDEACGQAVALGKVNKRLPAVIPVKNPRINPAEEDPAGLGRQPRHQPRMIGVHVGQHKIGLL